MKSDLANQINIGKDTEEKLIQSGIDSFEKLKSIGSEQAYIKLQTIDRDACINLLYGLDGAVNNIKWNKLPSERKEYLLQFYNMTRKPL